MRKSVTLSCGKRVGVTKNFLPRLAKELEKQAVIRKEVLGIAEIDVHAFINDEALRCLTQISLEDLGSLFVESYLRYFYLHVTLGDNAAKKQAGDRITTKQR